MTHPALSLLIYLLEFTVKQLVFIPKVYFVRQHLIYHIFDLKRPKSVRSDWNQSFVDSCKMQTIKTIQNLTISASFLSKYFFFCNALKYGRCHEWSFASATKTPSEIRLKWYIYSFFGHFFFQVQLLVFHSWGHVPGMTLFIASVPNRGPFLVTKMSNFDLFVLSTFIQDSTNRF